jgi:Uma2 family endonuclease
MAIGERVPRTVLTYEHYLELPNDGRRYEIIEGELYVSPAPTTRHQYVSMSLSARLFGHVRHRRLGRVLTAPCDVVLEQPSVVQPDILFVSRERRQIITGPNIQGAPDLVVEIISPSSTKTDQETKRDLYAKHGVPHYWVVEPMEEWVRAYELGPDGLYELVAEGHRDEQFSAPPFPDLVIPLGELWDDLGEDDA